MNNYSTIFVENYDPDQGIYVLSLNRSEKLNAINDRLIDDLRLSLEIIANSEKLGALIITSKIMKGFCAGIDVAYAKSLSNDEAAEFFADIAKILEQIASFPCPTVAVINGYAYGAGADLALSCDIRIAGESAQFRFPGPQFGVILGTHRLVNEVGPSVARKLALSNQVISADYALQYGMIHVKTDDSNALETGVSWARSINEITPFTFQGIRDICSQSEFNAKSPIDFARDSITQGDFQERFSHYLGKMKNR